MEEYNHDQYAPSNLSKFFCKFGLELLNGHVGPQPPFFYLPMGEIVIKRHVLYLGVEGGVRSKLQRSEVITPDS